MSEERLFSPEVRENFKNAFDAFDDDRDDLVSTDELGKLLRAVGFNPLPEEVEDMIEDINAPTFDYNSFMYIVSRHAREADPEQELIDSFRVFDKDGSGKLKTETIRKILRSLKQPFTEDQINELLGQATIDKNDCIKYDDFARLMLDF
ncbi:EF hand family protein [Histomonas meleagridis]|uniref:EF hand family protein n=1 Tax=Histomonas meleagridis TaxID=135588 RepID=UPI00355A9105|nr:EF hand family protein [Histomonas meleagridis]KAH0806201.1 EF hand family protein [Histomonas meleagridis]